MLFERAVRWGREWAGHPQFEEYMDVMNKKLIVQQVLSNRVADKSYLIDPQSNLPYGAETILEGGQVAMPAIGAEASVLRYEVPVGWNGMITNLAIVYTGGGFVSGSGDLVFRFEVGRRPYKTLNAVTIQIGSILGNQDIAGIRVYSGQLLEIFVRHVANVALNSPMVARIGGYVYPLIKG